MNIKKEFQYQNYSIRIYNDFRNPRRDFKTLGKIIINNEFYNKTNILTELTYNNLKYTLDDQLLLKQHYSIVKPIYYQYINNKLNISLNKFNTNILAWYVLENQQNKNIENLEQILIHEIQIYNAYLNNELYSYDILDKQNNIIHSLGLLIGIQNTQANSIKYINNI